MKRNISTWTVLVLIAVAASGSAQGVVKKRIEHLEAKKHYMEAADSWHGLFDAGETSAAVPAAMDYYRSHQFEKALPFFHYADSTGDLKKPDDVYAYFECLKFYKRYDEADALINKHLPGNESEFELALNANKAPFYKKVANYAGTKIDDMAINSEYSEFGPIPYNGWLYFQSTRPHQENKIVHGINNQPFYNMYTTPADSAETTAIDLQGEFGKPAVMLEHDGHETYSLPKGINKKHHDGPIMVSEDGAMLFITSNWSKDVTSKTKNIRLHIHYSTKQGDVWSLTNDFPYNNGNYSVAHPFFDYKTKTLYFSSDMPGGQGGFDLWKSVLNGNDSWSKPENLGAKINTPKNEVFPTMTKNGELIFSSSGWPGLGGLDVFWVETPGEEPLNLLNGINSERDDFGMHFSTATDGYMVSNRVGTVGDDDIFSFVIDLNGIREFHKPTVAITIVDAATNKPMAGKIQYTLAGKKVSVDVSESGVKLSVPQGTVLNASATDFVEKAFTVQSAGAGATMVLALTAVSPPPPVVAKPTFDLMPIHFDLDDFRIRKDAHSELDKLVKIMNDNPDLEVELSSHTDCRGTSRYNNKLSQQRAQASLEYVQKRITRPERVHGVGYGETKLLNHCDCSSSCSESLHQVNRRTEFRVVKY